MRLEMKQFGPIDFLVLALVFCWPTTDVRADDFLNRQFHLAPRDWELTTEFEGSKRNTDGAATTDMNFQEGLRVRQDGYILDPGIATFSLGQHFVLEQGKLSPAEGPSTSRAATFADYDASFSLLHGTVIPVTVSGFASRDSGTLSGDLGNRTEFVNRNRDIGAYYRNAYFPTSLRYSEQLRNQSVSSGVSNRVSDTDNILRTLSLQGKSTKMQLGMDYDLFTDKASADDRDYAETSANASHTFRWGKGSQLNSRSEFQTRTGFNPRRRFNIDEYVKLKHSSKLESAYNYRYSTLSQITSTVTHYGLAEFTHRLYKNLTTKINFTGTRETVDISQENDYLGQLSMIYQKGILWNGNLSTSAGIGYGYTERLSSGGLIYVNDESQEVAVSSIVRLRQRFIDAGSIIVTDLAGTTFYTEGLDYNVLSVSDQHIELQIIGGGLIVVGQTILIDYQYQSAPTMKSSNIPYNFRVGLDFGWISVFEQFSGTKYTLVAGEDGTFLRDQFDSKTGVNMRWRWPDLEAKATAAYGYSSTGDLKTDTVDLSQGLSYVLRSDFSLSANTGQNFVVSGGRLTEVYSANVFGNWTPSRGLFIRPFMNAGMNRSDPYLDASSGGINDKFVDTGFSLRWRVRRIDVSLRYNHDNRFGTTTNTDEDRLKLTFSRKF